MHLLEFEDYRYSQLKDAITEDDLKHHFKTLDLNKDGFIVSYELGLVKKLFDEKNYTRKDIDEMVAKVDVNSDGKVTFQGITM